MHVNIVISTFDRIDVLKMTINSLLNSSHEDISIYVIVDGNPEVYEKLKDSYADKADNTEIYKT